MSQPSTTAVALRALVMLAFLVAVPTIALFGTGVPDTIKHQIEKSLGISFTSTAQRTEAPLFTPTGPGSGAPTDTPLVPPVVSIPNTPGQPNMPGALPAANTPAAPISVAGPTAPITPPATPALAGPAPAQLVANPQAAPLGPVAPASPIGPQNDSRPQNEATPVVYNAPLAAPPAEPMVVRPEQSLAAPPVYPSNLAALAGQAVDHLAQVDRPGSTALPKAGPEAIAPSAPAENREPARPAAPSAAGDALLQIQNRLRELGATYSLLETWGGQGQLYRFYCKMAIGGNANYTRYFEATDGDPIRAMANVLQQVEAWRQSRL